jgi:hypothetical protein
MLDGYGNKLPPDAKWIVEISWGPPKRLRPWWGQSLENYAQKGDGDGDRERPEPAYLPSK